MNKIITPFKTDSGWDSNSPDIGILKLPVPEILCMRNLVKPFFDEKWFNYASYYNNSLKFGSLPRSLDSIWHGSPIVTNMEISEEKWDIVSMELQVHSTGVSFNFLANYMCANKPIMYYTPIISWEMLECRS